MMNVSPIDADRCRWQYLFPQGLREEYPQPSGKPIITTYTPAWCRGIVDRYLKFREASEAYGMPAQPLPVQIQHVGITGGGNTSVEERRRVGSIYDLTYVPAGGKYPSGVWALIEWTEEGIELIRSGKFNCLSPTNSKYGILSTGQKIPGDFLLEASLVDVPFLESIGTAADYLPFEALQYTGSRPVASLSEASRSIQYQKPNFKRSLVLISRGAQLRRVDMPENVTEEVMEEVAPDVVEAVLASKAMHEKMRAVCREMMEEEMDRMMESRGFPKAKHEAATPTLPAVTEAVTEVAEEVAEDIVSQARAIENKVIGDEVKSLVKAGRLLSAHVPDFVARRKTGSDVSGLVKDWSAASTMQGVQGLTPREKAPASLAKVTSDDIMKQVERELIARGKGYTYAEHLRLAKARINDALMKGELVEG